MAKALIPLDVISSNICADIGDSTFKHKFKITRHLLSGYRLLSTYLTQDFSVKTCVLDVDNSVNLPADFIYETKVGIRRNGRTAVLTLSDNVEYGKMNDSQCLSYLNSIWDGSWAGTGYYFYNGFRNGQYLGELYGAGRHVANSGFYSIDKGEGVIYIGSMVPKDAQIVIEYKSDGISNGLKLIPVELQETLEYYAKFKWYADRNITQSQINKNYYEQEYNKVKRLYNFQGALYMASEIQEMFSPTNY